MSVVWKTVLIAVILILAATGIIGFIFVKKAPTLLSDSLSEKLGVHVTVKDVSFTWNHVFIKGLEIDNVEDSILPKAFTAKTIIIYAPLFHFLQQNVVVNEIAVDTIYIGLEFDDIDSEKGNWTRLIEGFYSKMETEDTEISTRTVEIAKISLNNIQAQVVYKTNPSKIHTFPIVPHEEFTDIKSEGGVPVDQITNSVLGKMLMSLFVRENLKNMYKKLSPKNVLKKALSPFKLLIP